MKNKKKVYLGDKLIKIFYEDIKIEEEYGAVYQKIRFEKISIFLVF